MAFVFLRDSSENNFGQVGDAFVHLVDQCRVTLFTFGFFLLSGEFVFARARVDAENLLTQFVECDNVLLSDLKHRGMLDDTLVLFITEFGRTPFVLSGSEKVDPRHATTSAGSPAGSRV